VSERLDLDVAVIGGGVVGLACGMELASTRQVAVIERRERAGLETSSHNSGVIHAGIYYPTGSLKHTLCLEGNRLLYSWIEAHDVPAARLGKLIVAVDDSELGALELRARARRTACPASR
jgi:L-2-hydroxyglutarate oxidase LhgO